MFSDDAVARIHKASGPPRAVNNLAVQALIAAYAAGSIVDDKAARTAVTEETSA